MKWVILILAGLFLLAVAAGIEGIPFHTAFGMALLVVLIFFAMKGLGLTDV